jgi:very-short-patch-repair endonuclease
MSKNLHRGASSNLFGLAKQNRQSMTAAEEILWHRLRSNKLGCKFRRQHPISKFIADFYCASHKLVIEIDGEYHAQQKQADLERDDYLNSLNIKVIRFTNEQVIENLDIVLKEIQQTLQNLSSPLLQERGRG